MYFDYAVSVEATAKAGAYDDTLTIANFQLKFHADLFDRVINAVRDHRHVPLRHISFKYVDGYGSVGVSAKLADRFPHVTSFESCGCSFLDYTPALTRKIKKLTIRATSTMRAVIERFPFIEELVVLFDDPITRIVERSFISGKMFERTLPRLAKVVIDGNVSRDAEFLTKLFERPGLREVEVRGWIRIEHSFEKFATVARKLERFSAWHIHVKSWESSEHLDVPWPGARFHLYDGEWRMRTPICGAGQYGYGRIRYVYGSPSLAGILAATLSADRIDCFEFNLRNSYDESWVASADPYADATELPPVREILTAQPSRKLASMLLDEIARKYKPRRVVLHVETDDVELIKEMIARLRYGPKLEIFFHEFDDGEEYPELEDALVELSACPEIEMVPDRHNMIQKYKIARIDFLRKLAFCAALHERIGVVSPANRTPRETVAKICGFF